MALKKFARRDVILPAVVFLLTFVVALFSLRLLSLNQEKDERLRAVYAAESTISRVSSQLNRYLAESDFIKKYIESGHVLRVKRGLQLYPAICRMAAASSRPTSWRKTASSPRCIR